MAKLTVNWGNAGDEINSLLNASDKQLKQAVKEGAELLKTYTANKGRSMLHGPYWTGQTIAALTVKGPTKSGDGYAAQVTYAGKNRRGNPNSEVAFVNEYGARGKAARPFNRQAAEENEEAILQRMSDTILSD